MHQDFYQAADRECFSDAFNSPRQEDYRSVFHQDRDRVLFTTSFRRLQAKTQVFQAGEYDFYRTRLTHSLEVANIAKSIAAWLLHQNPEVRVDSDLLEAISLSHDIGHPPFGHSGERVLHRLMEKHGGFEGNAQSLRILTRTIYSQPQGRTGMSPSRALLDGILKYKRLFRDRGDEKNHFLYDDQAEILRFCFGVEDLSAVLQGGDMNGFRSLECQIMDLADDIAYSCFDVVDGVKARFITLEKVEARRDAEKEPEAQKSLDQLRGWIKEGHLDRRINKIIAELITSARLVPWENFLSEKTNRYRYRIVLPPEAHARIKLNKSLCFDLVFGSSALRQIEFKGRQILEALAGALFQNYREAKPQLLVPEGVHQAVICAASEAEKMRHLCDHLSGMTDAYAMRSYKRLFDPDYGSISELI